MAIERSAFLEGRVEALTDAPHWILNSGTYGQRSVETSRVPGALLRRMVLNMEPVGPSPWRNPNTGDEVRPLDQAEITEIQKDFVAAARLLGRWPARH